MSEENPKYVSALEKENFYIKNEYEKLASLYNSCIDSKASLESKMKSLEAEFDQLKGAEEAKIGAEVKKVNYEKKNIETKYEKVLKENRDFKSEISDLKKDKNSLNVAIKASKKELVEQSKRSDDKIRESEKKIVELTEYRKKRLSEDRELKKKQKKELKKANKTPPSSKSVTSANGNNNCVFPKDNITTNPNFVPPTLSTNSMNTITSSEISTQITPGPETSNTSSLLVSSAPISSNWNPTPTNTELTMTSNTYTSISMTNPKPSENQTAQPILMTDEYFYEKYLKPLQEGIQKNQKKLTKT